MEKGDALYGETADFIIVSTLNHICFSMPLSFFYYRMTLIFVQINIYADFPLLLCSAMELALSLEKLVNEKLLNVHSVMALYFSAFGYDYFCLSHNFLFPEELTIFLSLVVKAN